MRYRARAGQRVESEACAERQGTGRPERGERAGRRRRKDDDAEGGHSRTQTRRTRAKTRAPSSMSSSQTQSHRPRPDGVSRGGRASGRGRMASGGGTQLGVRVEARVCGRAARSQGGSAHRPGERWVCHLAIDRRAGGRTGAPSYRALRPALCTSAALVRRRLVYLHRRPAARARRRRGAGGKRAARGQNCRRGRNLSVSRRRAAVGGDRDTECERG